MTANQTPNDDRRTVLAEPKDQLSVLLEEYKTLRSEIQYRTQMQSIFIQLHVTTVVALTGASVVQQQMFGVWLLYLIPITSLIFGLWHLDSAAMIAKIGAYISDVIERRVTAPSRSQDFESEPILKWETRMREHAPAWAGPFRLLAALTFAVPGLVALAALQWALQSTALFPEILWFVRLAELLAVLVYLFVYWLWT